MTTNLIGVDPGVTGGVAILTADSTLITLPMPADLREFANLVADASHVIVEKAQSFPGQGIASAFNYGRHFGELLGAIIAQRVPFSLVSPGTWTRSLHVGVSGTDPKKKSAEAARRLFPNHDFRASVRCKKPHDGMVDAALILEWGRRWLAGKEAA